MSEETCEICDDLGHVDDVIWVDGKAFCRYTYRRIWTEEEAEEMTDEQMAEAQKERIRLVRPAVPAEWEIVAPSPTPTPP